VQKVFTILIADRNPRVRGFLQRELSIAGYRVRLAESARDLLEWACDRDPVDLIILDPDLPDAVDPHLMGLLRKRMPGVPVVIHAHPSQVVPGQADADSFVRVEKGGSSVERLKEVAEGLLKRAQAALAESMPTPPPDSS
jgi:DNA-binding NtrC family response regulator